MSRFQSIENLMKSYVFESVQETFMRQRQPKVCQCCNREHWVIPYDAKVLTDERFPKVWSLWFDCSCHNTLMIRWKGLLNEDK